MTLGSFLVRLCIAPVVGWVTYRAFTLLYKHVGDPMWRTVLFGPRNERSLDPKAVMAYESQRQAAKFFCYLGAAAFAAAVFAV